MFSQGHFTGTGQQIKQEKRSGNQQAVHQVQHATDPGQNGTGIFDLTGAFEGRFRKVTRHTTEEKQHTQDHRSPEIAEDSFNVAQRPEKIAEQQGKNESADCTFIGFSGADGGDHFMVAAVVAECITGKRTGHIRSNIADLCHKQQIQEQNMI